MWGRGQGRGDRQNINQSRRYGRGGYRETEWQKEGKIQRDSQAGTGGRRRNVRARADIYQGTHPPWRISVYGKSTETGFTTMMVFTSAGGSQMTQPGILGGETLR